MWRIGALRSTGCMSAQRVALIPKTNHMGPLRTIYGAAKAKLGPKQTHYDLVVLGGGSGGLSLVHEASKLPGHENRKILLLDYVMPSEHGNTWGLGGTCVNVGCIPKKLFHHAAQHGDDAQHLSSGFGYTQPDLTHNWAQLVTNIQTYIKTLNFGYRSRCITDGVEYVNAYGKLQQGSNKDGLRVIHATMRDKSEAIVTADHVVVATGGRPHSLSGTVENGEMALSSDDIFSRTEVPGKTLVLGGSYTALEVSGFLNSFGYNTTLMTRGMLIRGYDRQIAGMIAEDYKRRGVNVRLGEFPSKFTRDEDTGKYTVWKDDEILLDNVDTIFSATGRYNFGGANLVNTDSKVVLHEKSGFIVTNEYDETHEPNVYAIGDAAHGRPALTPVAIQAGKLLARRLFGQSTTTMSYGNVPTTFFTPTEYSCVGLPEEAAIELYGEANIEVYHTHFTPLPWALRAENDTVLSDNQCYLKVLCLNDDAQTIIGLHFFGPHAGEVMQGFAVAFKRGLTYTDLVDTVGIHPTSAEEVTSVHVTKRSGDSPLKTGC